MKRGLLQAVSLGCLLLATSGCYTPMVARYIYQDGEYGVVGIPVNSYVQVSHILETFRDRRGRCFCTGRRVVI